MLLHLNLSFKLIFRHLTLTCLDFQKNQFSPFLTFLKPCTRPNYAIDCSLCKKHTIERRRRDKTYKAAWYMYKYIMILKSKFWSKIFKDFRFENLYSFFQHEQNVGRPFNSLCEWSEQIIAYLKQKHAKLVFFLII